MTGRSWVAVVAGVILVLTAVGIGLLRLGLAEEHDISQGTFRGFSIGDSPAQALNQVLKLNGQAIITAIPRESFVISSKNIDDIGKIRDSSGIRVMNYRGMSVNVLFFDGHISQQESSIPAHDLRLFDSGDSTEAVVDKLRKFLGENADYIVLPIVDIGGHNVFHAAQLDNAAESRLLLQPAWRFEVPSETPAGAVYELYFLNGHLGRIKYLRQRFQIE